MSVDLFQGILCKGSTLVGALVLTTWTFQVLRWAYINFFAAVDLKSRYRKAGEWAVVTGASEGIGRAMAIDLAKRGFKVCIIARTQSKLAEVAQKIKERGSEAKIVTFDFAAADDAAYKKLFDDLNTIDLAVIVNNVGVNYSYPLNFYKVDPEEDMRLIKVNCEAQIRMTKYAIKRLKEKKCGGIVDLSSKFADVPAPLLATYAATKAFNKALSTSLAAELKADGVDVLTVTPMLVCSAMTKINRPSFNCPLASVMAKQTLNKLSLVSFTEGHRHHEILGTIMDFVPTNLTTKLVMKVNTASMKKSQKKEAAAAAAAAKNVK